MINIYVENMFTKMEFIYILIRKVNYNNDSFRVYPKVIGQIKGEKAGIGFIVINSNIDILKDIIIDDIEVIIAGIKPNYNRLIVNLNMDTRKVSINNY